MTYRVLGVESMAVMCSVAAKIWKEGREEECLRSYSSSLPRTLSDTERNMNIYTKLFHVLTSCLLSPQYTSGVHGSILSKGFTWPYSLLYTRAAEHMSTTHFQRVYLSIYRRTGYRMCFLIYNTNLLHNISVLFIIIIF